MTDCPVITYSGYTVSSLKAVRHRYILFVFNNLRRARPFFFSPPVQA